MNVAGVPRPGEMLIRSFSKVLAQTEAISREQMEAYQAELLTRLVSFAQAASPFYRERLSPLFRRGAAPDLTAWLEIPILHRADIEAEFERMIPERIPDDAGQVLGVRTSGTTGARLNFRSCTLDRMATESMMNRFYRWHGFDLGAPMASIRAYPEGSREYPEGFTESRWSRIGEETQHHTLSARTRIGDQIEWLVRRRPAYLVTTPSIAHEIAAHPQAADVKALGLKRIVAIGEIVTEDAYTAVREQLGCEMIQVYGCREAGSLALQSPADDCLLLCEETALVEVLDDAGTPVAPGETGRVVLTSLYNYAMPFVRYEIGDYATLDETPCSSGLSLKPLKRVEGRRRNALTTASGQKIWRSDPRLQEILAGLCRGPTQVMQPNLESIEIRTIMHRDSDRPAVGALRDRFAAFIGRPIKLELGTAEGLERPDGMKFEPIVSALS